MNDIVITGATGVVGRRAVRELVASGHRVAGVTRSAGGRRLLESLGARSAEADVFDQASLTAVFAGADAVVNLLTRIPPADRMGTPGAWDENALRPAMEEIPPLLEPVARSQRVSSRRLREGTGWAPLVRAGTDGWRLILEQRVTA